MLRVQEEKRQEILKLSRQNRVLCINKPVQNVKKKHNLLSPQHFQLNRNTDKIRNNNVICRICAGGHPAIDCKTTAELFCAKCYKFGHVRAVRYSNNQLFRHPNRNQDHILVVSKLVKQPF